MKSYFSKSLVVSVICMITSLFNIASASIIHTVEDGLLIGATGVVVDDVSYDVRFTNGTCFDLFEGCNGMGSFFWSTEADANNAMTALRDQVFINTPLYDFDSNHRLTSGCETASRQYCDIRMPYKLFTPADGLIRYQAMVLTNYASFSDVVRPIGVAFPRSPIYDYDTWAVWSESTVINVPIPSTISYFAFLPIIFLFLGKTLVDEKVQKLARWH